MATTNHSETAKIYQFPVKGRAGAALNPVPSKQVLDRAPRADCAGGGCWYHEAALHEVDVVPQR